MLFIIEKVKFVILIIRKRFFNKVIEIYVFNFKIIVKYFCFSVSGRFLIKEIGKGLRLGERDMELVLVILYRFGN